MVTETQPGSSNKRLARAVLSHRFGGNDACAALSFAEDQISGAPQPAARYDRLAAMIGWIGSEKSSHIAETTARSCW